MESTSAMRSVTFLPQMRIIARDPGQTTQRIRVGMIGLAAVLLLIGLAAAVLATATRERPLRIAGAASPATVANMAAPGGGAGTDAKTSEPLAELGVAPSTTTDDGNVAAANQSSGLTR